MARQWIEPTGAVTGGSKTFDAAGGSFSILLMNVTICHVCAVVSVFFHAGIPVQRVPCWMM